jgi:hypothetical protein
MLPTSTDRLMADAYGSGGGPKPRADLIEARDDRSRLHQQDCIRRSNDEADY